MTKLLPLAVLAVLLPVQAVMPAAHAQSARPAAHSVQIVAAENFYGDVAGQIAGPHAHITSVLSNPDQDPHLFEASPSVARSLSGARIVIYNGADYDPWMAKLLQTGAAPGRVTIVAADLVGKHAGDNPHLWYDPATMPAVARSLSDALASADPEDKADFEARLARFTESLKPIDAKVAAMRAKFAGTPVTATEPVFGYMAAALGLEMRNERFQLAVMNDTEPSASDVAAMEADLKQHRVKLFLYNSQATDAAARRLLAIAKAAHVPVVGVTETEPAGQNYQRWMLSQLAAVDAALGSAP